MLLVRVLLVPSLPFLVVVENAREGWGTGSQDASVGREAVIRSCGFVVNLRVKVTEAFEAKNWDAGDNSGLPSRGKQGAELRFDSRG